MLSIAKRVAALRETSLFNALPDKDLGRIAELCRAVDCEKEEFFFHAGDPAEGFYVVVSGQVKVFVISPNGQEHILHIFRAGDTVAEAALFDLKTYPASCMALSGTVCLFLRRRDALALLEDHPKLALAVIEGLSRRLRKFVAKIEDLSLKQVTSRLATYLRENALDRQGTVVCRLDISKATLASRIGTIKETLSRSFRKLKDLGVIHERPDGSVEIRNRPALDDIARGFDFLTQ